MTHPDIALGVVTAATTILGAVFAAHTSAKKGQEITYVLGFVVLGILGICFVVFQPNQTAVANTNLNNALTNLAHSTAQIQISNAALARAQEQNAKLQQKLLDSNATISDLARREINTATGGNGFCYLQIALMNDTGGVAFAIPHGEYPRYGVTARVVDVRVFESAVKQEKQPELGTVYKIGDMTHVAAYPVGTIPFSDPVSQDFNIFFTARNGLWTEQLRLRKLNEKMGRCYTCDPISREESENRDNHL